MAQPERLAYEAVCSWERDGHLTGLAVSEIVDHLDQLIAMARDEERARRCPGIDDPRCLKIRGVA